MDGNRYRKKINKLKKLAAKSESWLFIAKILICIYVIANALFKKFRTPIWRTAISMALVMIFVSFSSFRVESYYEGIPYDDLYNAYYIDADYDEQMVEAEINEEEWTRMDNEEDMADLDDIAANVDQEAEEEITETAAVLGEAEGQVKFDKNDWNLILVNKTHSVPSDYTFTLGTIKGDMRCDERILPYLKDMFKAASQDGITLVVCSPYRDMARQEKLFERKMKNYIAEGYSYMDAYREASSVVTVPGTSEHQLGLALDIVSNTYSMLNAGFGDTAAGKWLMDHAHEYGFIMRYPRDKENITGIIYEPWHYRFVGQEAAKYIYENGICLEEFIERI